MSQEIIYTSSPRGLRPGSRGFCTVASTPGMAKTLAERLESLSGYRHVFPPNSPSASLNPIAYSHLILSVGGQSYHVLSRVADAGLDYSQRTNKLAHHIALVPSELNAAGPAWSLGQPGLMETDWTGDPRILPSGRSLPGGDVGPSMCNAWLQAKGDAGWAGVVAEVILDTNPRKVYIIYRPGMSVLPLLMEVEALLPESIRWQFTFSTYYANLPPDVNCRCRCVLADTPDATAASRQAGVIVVDLQKANEPAPNTDAANAARQGTYVGHLPASQRLPNRPPYESTTPDIELDSEPSDLFPSLSAPTAAVVPRNASLPPSASPPPTRPPKAIVAPRPAAPQKNRSGALRIAAGIVGLMLFGTLMFGAGYYVAMKTRKPNSRTEYQTATTLGTPRPDVAAQGKGIPNEPTADKAVADKAVADKAAADKAAEKTGKPEPSNTSNATTSDERRPEMPPVDTQRVNQLSKNFRVRRSFELPRLSSSNEAAKEITVVPGSSRASDLKLSLFSLDLISDNGMESLIKKELSVRPIQQTENAKQNSCRWAVLCDAADIAFIDISENGEACPVTFAWTTKTTDGHRATLTRCILIIENGSERSFVRLDRPAQCQPLAVSKDQKGNTRITDAQPQRFYSLKDAPPKLRDAKGRISSVRIDGKEQERTAEHANSEDVFVFGINNQKDNQDIQARFNICCCVSVTKETSERQDPRLVVSSTLVRGDKKCDLDATLTELNLNLNELTEKRKSYSSDPTKATQLQDVDKDISLHRRMYTELSTFSSKTITYEIDMMISDSAGKIAIPFVEPKQ